MGQQLAFQGERMHHMHPADTAAHKHGKPPPVCTRRIQLDGQAKRQGCTPCNTKRHGPTLRFATKPAWRNQGNTMHRQHVNKRNSAHQFKQNTKRTKAPNMKGAPMRGGIRL